MLSLEHILAWTIGRGAGLLEWRLATAKIANDPPAIGSVPAGALNAA
jgi:hypothetical protein